MQESTFQKCAGTAPRVVGLTSIAFGFIFLLVIPEAQKGPAPNALVSYAATPAPAQVTIILLIVGSLSALVTIIGIYRLLHKHAPGWAFLSLIVGTAFTILTAIDATYTAFLFPWLSHLYATGDTAVKAYAALSWNAPSPINPYDFVEFCVSSLWLLVTGALIIRTVSFRDVVGYLALVAVIGQFALFVSTFTGTLPLMLGIGVPGAVVVGPIFWLLVGATLWTKADKPQVALTS